ncbi:MAG: response regulator transcription factor [Nitriliruptoraceae bacterium]
MTQSNSPADRIRLLLVDDHEVVRQGLRLLLERVLGYDVTEASSGLQALSLIETSRPDVVLLDARMPEHDGIWTLQQIRQRFAEVPVIILSTYDSREYVDGAIEHGAAGYLLKDASSEQLQEAISTAREGRGLYLHPQVAQRLVARTSSIPNHIALSEREQEILQLVVAGRSTDEIAVALYVAGTTVKTHLTSIYRKLDVANRTQAVAKAIREGIIDTH